MAPTRRRQIAKRKTPMEIRFKRCVDSEFKKLAKKTKSKSLALVKAKAICIGKFENELLGSPNATLFEKFPKLNPFTVQRHRCVVEMARDLLLSGRCVTTDEAVSRAFAICTRMLQETDYLEPGTATPTAKGRRKSLELAELEDAVEMEKEFLVLLEEARKQRRARKQQIAERAPRTSREARARRLPRLSRTEEMILRARREVASRQSRSSKSRKTGSASHRGSRLEDD